MVSCRRQAAFFFCDSCISIPSLENFTLCAEYPFEFLVSPSVFITSSDRILWCVALTILSTSAILKAKVAVAGDVSFFEAAQVSLDAGLSSFFLFSH